MKITFHDIGKTVDVPDGTDESGIDDIHDSVLKDVTSGATPPIENHNNILQRAAQFAGQLGSETLNQANQAAYGAENTALLGLPDYIQKKTGVGINPGPPKTMGQNVAKMAGNIGGFALGGPEAAGKGAASMLPEATNPFINGFVKNAASMGSLSPMELGAEKSNPLIEAAKVGGAGLLGGTIEGVAPLIGQGANFVKNVFTSGGKLADVNDQLANNTNELLNINTPKDTSYGSLTESQGTQLGQRVLKKAQNSMTGEVQESGDAAVDKTTQNYKTQKTDLAGKFNKATEGETAAYKTAMDSTGSENTALYGQRLDELQANLKTPITADEYNQKVIEPALGEIAQKRLPLGGPEATIKSWSQKFSPVPDEAGPPQTDDLGMPIPKAPKETQAPLTLRGINNIKNDVYNSQSYGSRMGSAKPDPSDVGANIFQKYHAQFLNDRVPGHAELQADAGPMIESTRNVFKAVRPGEEDLQPGMNLLQKAAKGQANPAKANPDIARDLGRVEKGSGGFSGTGNLRGQSTEIAKNMRDLDLKFTGDKQALLDQIDKKIGDIKASFAEDSSTIKRGGIENKQNMLERQGQLTQQKSTLESQQKDLQKLKTVRDWAISGSLGAVGWEGLWNAKKKILG